MKLNQYLPIPPNIFLQKNIAFALLMILCKVSTFAQYSSIDTVYYPNGQIYKIWMVLKGDSIAIEKSYYLQYEGFDGSTFYLGEKKWGKRSVKHGKWIYKEEAGQTKKVEVYKKGKLKF